MKKVLIISFYFPPSKGVGGKRIYQLYKYLSQYNWTPYILTAKTKNNNSEKVYKNVFRTNFFDFSYAGDILNGILDKILSLFRLEMPEGFFKKQLVFPDYQLTWTLGSILKGYRIIKRENIDLIYVSCKPASAGILGAVLKLLTKRKVVIEFRDPWGIIFERENIVVQKMTMFLQNLYIKCSDMFLVVAPGTQKLYDNFYKNKTIEYVPNSYDEEDVIDDGLVSKEEHFIIFYYGLIYGGREFSHILEIIDEMDEAKIKFIFAGKISKRYLAQLEKFKCFFYAGFLSADKMKEMLRKASILYLNHVNIEGEASILSRVVIAAKTQEYLASGIPILADLVEGDNLDLVREFAKEYYEIKNKSTIYIKNVILDRFKEWENNKLERKANASFLEEYHPKVMSEKIASLLDKVANL